MDTEAKRGVGRTERAGLIIYALPCVKYIAGKQLPACRQQLMFHSGPEGRIGKGVEWEEAGEGICILRTPFTVLYSRN